VSQLQKNNDSATLTSTPFNNELRTYTYLSRSVYRYVWYTLVVKTS